MPDFETKYNELLNETIKLVSLMDKYKNRWISSEQAEIRKQKEKVQRLTNPEIAKAIQLQQTLKF